MKRSLMLWIASVLLIGLVVQLPPNVYAKMDLRVEDQVNEWGDFESPFETDHATPFTGFFGRLGVYGDVDVLAFDFEESTEAWGMDIAVPQCGVHFEPFYPAMALIGPGLDAPEADVLPFDIPDDFGAIVVREADHDQPRPVDTYGLFEYDYYINSFVYENIPQAGRYYVAVWEPNGHVGAYALQTGNTHPELEVNRMEEIEADFRRIERGEWIGINCDEAPIVDSCPATEGETVVSLPTAPEASRHSEGYRLTGIVRDAETCLPIAEAQILAAVANGDDHSHTMMLHSNLQGAFQLVSPISSPSDHLLVVVSVIADGYRGVETQHEIDLMADRGEFAINLLPN